MVEPAQTPEELALQVSIENLYEVFSVYPVPLNLEGCPHCVDPKESQYLVSKPLRSLTSDELWRYNFKALTTWGTETDLKYFLPRLLALPVDLEFTMGKLGYGKWRTWPAEEQLAIEQYLLALWQVAIVTSLYSPGAFLMETRDVFDDFQPLIDIWQQKLLAGNRSALEVLVASLVGGYLTNNSTTQEKTVTNWVLRDNIGSLLEQAFFQYSDDPTETEFAAELSQAYERRAWLQWVQSL